MGRRIVLTFLLALPLAAGAAACGGGGGETASAGATRQVVAAFYPLAFAAAKIGGDGVEVVSVTPTGAEPHDVELSPRTVERVRGADVVLYLGGGFQPALERALEGAEGEPVDLLQAVGVRPADGEGAADPHVWLDPRRFATLAARIGDALDRPRAAGELQVRLRELDEAYAAGLRGCERRELVTSHAAFGYMAERYGLEQIALAGTSPEAEPTPRDLERLAAAVRRHGATTVFVEPLVSPRVAETVAREAGARTATLNPIEGLTEAEAARGEDYFSLMRANLATLREALACR